MAKKVTGPGGGEDRAAYWRAVIERWRTSGQTQAAFCRQRHIGLGSFVGWKHRLARTKGGGQGTTKRSAKRDRAPAAGFVEVSLSGPGPDGADRFGYELELRGGRRVRLTEAFTEAGLARLLSILERPC